jgi:hypothetical protein
LALHSFIVSACTGCPELTNIVPAIVAADFVQLSKPGGCDTRL